ncbi:Rv2175c family DNA-binding protein [Falsarthrobacter nasiphocae]|uniref:DNA-binding protein n=1 Tax=Falsarthrobacter nasiphocae TaxID=189863 RepID=A0AAE3YGG2_9MICC|nr:Rv2175c family DNA-binding protein [Falsarthrobacter nasiphocae]MDR6891331.1 hypothetical protein [Falsarthrobacter nasiphocae]
MTDTTENSLSQLVPEWLTLPDVAEILDVPVTHVHRLVADGTLLAMRVGEPPVRKIPAAFLAEGKVLDSLKGTVSVLRDAGYDDEAALRWLFTPDESLPGTPAQALVDGRKTEIRRRAQSLAW